MSNSVVRYSYNKVELKSSAAFGARSEKIYYPVTKAEWGPFVLNAGDRTKSLGVPVARCAGAEIGNASARRIVAALNALCHFPTAVLEDPNFNIALDLVIGYNMLQRHRAEIQMTPHAENSPQVQDVRIAYRDAKTTTALT